MAAGPRKKRFALYWCTTLDGGEDWFVVAHSAAAARRFHEDYEGYDTGDAEAERLMRLPEQLVRRDGWMDPDGGSVRTGAGWPSDALLLACGGDVAELPRDALRDELGMVCKAVRFGDRVFRAGDLVTSVEHTHGIRKARLAIFRGGQSRR